MSTETEAAGALIDASLVAHEIETARPARGAADAHDACRNCGAGVQGRFCHVCGQAAHIHRSLLHLGEELLHGLFHFDAKGWRTLPLLIARPGLLTRRYIDGQRARYVSPLALFLFMVFLMFFAASLTSTPPDLAGASGQVAEVRVDLERDTAKARAAVAKAELELERARARNADLADAQEALADAREELGTLEIAARAVAPAMDAAASAIAAAASSSASASASASAAGAGAETATRVPPWAAALRERPLRTGHPSVDAAVRRAADNPELTIYKLKNTAYKYSFMLVPISLPFLWLMFFWRRGIAMYDHAVFVLYSLSFMSLLFVALMALGSLHASAAIPWLASLAPPLHMAAQLRETYRLGRWGTVWRTLVLLVVSAVVFALFLLLIVYLTMG
jgi:hypothetical protein